MNYATAADDINRVIRDAREVTIAFLKRECADRIRATGDIEAGRKLLLNYAAQNRSEWSGGQATGMNIHEAITREEAIKLANFHDLNYLTFDYRTPEEVPS